jgi:predicted nucleic acid-binding protein
VRFWDSSAVILLCVDDSSTPIVRRLAREDEAMAAWWGTVVECCSALSRLLRQGDLAAPDLARARYVLDRLAEGWSEILPGPEIRDQAIRLLGLHPLRAADALQLAAGLVWADRRPRGYHFVCLDTRLREAARAEGFFILPK